MITTLIEYLKFLYWGGGINHYHSNLYGYLFNSRNVELDS